MSSLTAVAQELYGLLPGEFTAARNARATGLRAAGETDLAAAVRALPKPTVAAWAVNTMVRRMAAEIEDVLELGATLRQAQADLDAAELRRLTTQRRRLTAAVARQGATLAADLGQPLGPAAQDDVEATLHAALTDDGAAAALRTGLLVAPLRATGLAPADLDGAVAVPAALGERAPRERIQVRSLARGRSRRAEQDRRRLAEAEEGVRRAEAAAEEAAATVERAVARRDRLAVELSAVQARGLQLRAELEELRREVAEREHALSRLEGDLDRAAADLAEAETDRDEAASERSEARAAVEEARAELDRLRGQDPSRSRG